MTSLSIIGDTPRRREDVRFTTGQGSYLDDLPFEGLVQAVMLRSPHAHALIEHIDESAARAMPGVLAILTSEDARKDGLQSMRPTVEANVQTGAAFAFAPQPLLASPKVRHVGEPVALVVAKTRAQALDAAEQVAVAYQPLPAVATAADACAAGASQIADEVPGNVCMDWCWGDAKAADAAFAAAAHIVSLRVDNHRVITNPMEPPGAVGIYDATSGRYTLYVSSQNIHGNRAATARSLGVAAADIAGFPARCAESKAHGRLRGLGYAYHIKGTGGSPHENVDIRFESDGSVSLITGTQTIGQGHETTFPQILADRLGIPNQLIRLHQGDTDLIPTGGGHGSSRATYMGGTAIWRASETIVQKGRAIAADMMEAATEDIVFADGRFAVVGANRTVELLDVATRAREDGAPLDTYHAWTREHMTFPNGTHVVEVEIDPDTGSVALVRLTAMDDYGVLVNPMIATGQARGAIGQGVGQALMEQAVYDEKSGQLLTGSFMDYALPRADDLPSFHLEFNGTRCATNPLGVKGCGEAGAVAMLPALQNAIVDALTPLGITHFDGPATPFRVWQAIHAIDGATAPSG